MAYIRGQNYIWSDEERVHLWAADGNDGWSESLWAEGSSQRCGAAPAEKAPSGVGMRQDVVDLYVVMRFAELLGEGRVADLVEQALSRYQGNGGCLALRDLAPNLLRTLGRDPLSETAGS